MRQRFEARQGFFKRFRGVFLHRISFSVETPPFRAAGSDFIWEGCNPFQIRAIHRAVLYVPSCVLEHSFGCSGKKRIVAFLKTDAV
ncbi:hypothetical protein E4O60_02605 [Neisseria meningitidis]|nr:hypothetical protein [Neisseria meningitidis]